MGLPQDVVYWTKVWLHPRINVYFVKEHQKGFNMSRILFAGNHNIGHDVLEMLLDEGCSIVGVLAHPPSEDYLQNWYRSVANLASSKNIPVYQPKSLKNGKIVSVVRSLEPDLLISVSYGKIIPEDILSIPKLGAFNLHGSLLPDYRGRFSPIWALVNDEQYSGMTLHMMDKGVDTGDIVDQVSVKVVDEDTGFSLHVRQCAYGLRMLRRNLPKLLSGCVNLKPQPYLGKYFGAMSDVDREAKWNSSTRTILNLVRACFFPPYPSSYTYLNRKRVSILRVEPVPERFEETAGKVVKIRNDRPIVATGDGAVLLIDSELSAPTVGMGDILGSREH